MSAVFKLHMGDCIASVRTMSDASIDSIVTDPPYELGFMGKTWDASGIANNVEMWTEALRVLKPGGHLLAFSGSRTYHRMVCAIEDAGFDIRDQIMWIYGSGFPKSLDVSKAIDKARTEDVGPLRVLCRAVRAAMDARGMKSRDMVQHFGGCDPRLIDHWAARDTDSQPSMPTWEQWCALRTLFDELRPLDAEAWRLNGRKGAPGDAWQTAEVIGVHAGEVAGLGGERFTVADKTIREPSDAARQWEGWGTALKPAHEPICVARKPLIGTVAANVLAHGTGALNIDGCRVGDEVRYNAPAGNKAGGNSLNMSAVGMPQDASGREATGRWPANLIHDGSDEVLAAFPDSNGSGAARALKRGARDGEGWGMADPPGELRDAGTGSAARFFYCAKASKSDREDGNVHPTVKPTDLMAYLVRLVTPPGGTVLDPFTGSGSTGKACMREGFNFVGCELSPEYLTIAKARIEQEQLQAAIRAYDAMLKTA